VDGIGATLERDATLEVMFIGFLILFNDIVQTWLTVVN